MLKVIEVRVKVKKQVWAGQTVICKIGIIPADDKQKQARGQILKSSGKSVMAVPARPPGPERCCSMPLQTAVESCW